MTLAERITELELRHGSLRAVGRVLQVDHAYLYRLKNGESVNPSDDVLRKLKLREIVTYERTESPCPLT